MVSMTTPQSPRNKWAPRTVRLDDQSWKDARVKLATDEESWQGVMETLARGWLAGVIDVDSVRKKLQKAEEATSE
ncbi:hypothetical protein [Nocardia spumae]|uniref:hypothetical protein n=1 Tax=Nocardia spumae TaxID=2887190 RepID=UPI001D15C3AE|nr:hypothetical protein [Nocardia spumae]